MLALVSYVSEMCGPCRGRTTATGCRTVPRRERESDSEKTRWSSLDSDGAVSGNCARMSAQGGSLSSAESGSSPLSPFRSEPMTPRSRRRRRLLRDSPLRASPDSIDAAYFGALCDAGGRSVCAMSIEIFAALTRSRELALEPDRLDMFWSSPPVAPDFSLKDVHALLFTLSRRARVSNPTTLALANTWLSRLDETLGLALTAKNVKRLVATALRIAERTLSTFPDDYHFAAAADSVSSVSSSLEEERALDAELGTSSSSSSSNAFEPHSALDSAHATQRNMGAYNSNNHSFGPDPESPSGGLRVSEDDRAWQQLDPTVRPAHAAYMEDAFVTALAERFQVTDAELHAERARLDVLFGDALGVPKIGGPTLTPELPEFVQLKA